MIGVFYCALISLLLFFLMFLDKRRAIKHGRRIPERRLLLLGLLGGGLGGLSGMFLFRHKTRKPRFYAVFVLGMVLMIMIIIYTYYSGIV